MSRPNNVLALEVSAKNGEELFIMRYVSYANFSLPTRLFRWETGPLDDILMPIVHLSCSCRISITYIQKVNALNINIVVSYSGRPTK